MQSMLINCSALDVLRVLDTWACESLELGFRGPGIFAVRLSLLYKICTYKLAVFRADKLSKADRPLPVHSEAHCFYGVLHWDSLTFSHCIRLA